MKPVTLKEEFVKQNPKDCKERPTSTQKCLSMKESKLIKYLMRGTGDIWFLKINTSKCKLNLMRRRIKSRKWFHLMKIFTNKMSIEDISYICLPMKKWDWMTPLAEITILKTRSTSWGKKYCMNLLTSQIFLSRFA